MLPDVFFNVFFLYRSKKCQENKLAEDVTEVEDVAKTRVEEAVDVVGRVGEVADVGEAGGDL